MLYVISVSFILIPADEFPVFYFQLLTFPEIFNFSSFNDGLFPRRHCSDFFSIFIVIVSAKHGHNKYWKLRRSFEVESYRTSPANSFSF